MAGISITCESCGASLKLPDTRMVGKRVKCPKCSAKFVLTLPQPELNDPEEVPLQLVDTPVRPAQPLVGTSPRWVPDSNEPNSAPPAGSSPVSPLPPGILDFTGGQTTSPTAGFPQPNPAAVQPVAPSIAVGGIPIAPSAETGSVIDRVKSRRKKSLSVPVISGVTILLLATIGAGIVLLRDKGEKTPGKPKIQANLAYQESVAEQANANESAKSLSPTDGAVIPVDYLPFTPQVLIHMHPAALWKGDPTTAEFQAMLSTLGIWLNEQITLRTRFEPSEISELTFAINFGPRMSAPEVAAVVRLNEPQTDQEFMKRFKGRIYADPKVELYEAPDYCYLKVDQQTFAVAPANMSESLAMSLKYPALLLPDMEPLVKQSDRDRHLTMLFDLKIVDSHREDAFIAQLQQLADKFLFWFGEDVQVVSWSMHLEHHLYMETLLHQTQASTPVKLHRGTQLRLSKLADEILDGVRHMRPSTVGARQMIGRFPAMIKALEIGTTSHVDPAGVRLVTLLPQHAAANLAAGAILTWNQSLLTDFTDNSHLTRSEIQKIPDTIAERLQMNVLVDFRAMPLQEAMAYIGDSIKTEITIDGDALKAAGFTQNMPQTYDLGTVSGLKAFDTIFAKYATERDPMIMVVDEADKKILISTVSKAKADGQTPYPTH